LQVLAQLLVDALGIPSVVDFQGEQVVFAIRDRLGSL
jgi:hypothetical protein